MKSIKTLSLLGAIIATMLGGAAPASASFDTQLCKVASAELTCPAGQAVTSIHQLATLLILKTSLATMHCEYVLFQGTVLALGKPQIIHGNLTLVLCSIPASGQKCTVTEISPGTLVTVLKLGSGEKSAVTKEGEFNIKCGALINCTYGGKELVGDGTGPTENASGTDHVTYVEDPVARTGGLFCPKTTTLTALFEGLEPSYLRS